MIEFPEGIDTENAKAWYLRMFCNLSWPDIGRLLYEANEEDEDLNAREEEPRPFIVPVGYDLDYQFVWGRPPVCAVCGQRIRPGEAIRWRQRVIGERPAKRRKGKMLKVRVQELIHAIRIYDGQKNKCLRENLENESIAMIEEEVAG